MPYTENLEFEHVKKPKKLKKPKKILFYLNDDKNGEFSNFERSEQIINGVVYKSNEHYYQSCKAKNLRVWAWIKKAPNPFLAMMAGRSLRKKEMVDNWDSIKVDVMLKGLRAKFSQNEELEKKLSDTGNATLHEDSPIDEFWGIKGHDMLGKLLMQVRAELNLLRGK